MSALLETSFRKLHDHALSIIADGVYDQRMLRVREDVRGKLAHLGDDDVDMVAALIVAAHDEWSMWRDAADLEEAAGRLRDIAQRMKTEDREQPGAQ